MLAVGKKIGPYEIVRPMNHLVTIITASAVIFDLHDKLPIKRWKELSAIPETTEIFAPFSWSDDGKWLAGRSYVQDKIGPIFLYSLESEKYEKFEYPAGELDWQFVTPVWLHDNRRLLFGFEKGLLLLDSLTGKSKTITTFARSREVSWFRTSQDDRTIYYQRATTEGDLWLLKFK